MGRASKYAKFNLGSEGVVENGEPVVVYSIVVANTAGTAPTIQATDSDGNLILNLFVFPFTTATINCDWLADNGLKFPAITDSIRISVFHSQPGA